MVDTTEIAEMEKLGVTKRKSESKEGEYDYNFKVDCPDCGKKVEWCYCAKSLEDVKKVLKSERKIYCGQCQFKPEHLSKSMLKRVGEIIKKEKPDAWTIAVTEMWEEFSDGPEPDEPHELDDGTQFWDCSCPT